MSLSGLIWMGIGGSGDGSGDTGRQMEEFINFGLVSGEFVAPVPPASAPKKKMRNVYKPIPEEDRRRAVEEALAAAQSRLDRNAISVKKANEKIGQKANIRTTRERMKKVLTDD